MWCSFKPLMTLWPLEKHMEPFDPPNFVNNIINLGLEEGGVAESKFLGGEFQVHSRAIPLQILCNLECVNLMFQVLFFPGLLTIK